MIGVKELRGLKDLKRYCSTTAVFLTLDMNIQTEIISSDRLVHLTTATAVTTMRAV